MRGPGAALAGSLVDLVLPRTCAGCGVPGPALCRRCTAALASPREATPRRPPPGLPPTVAAGAYAGPVRPAVAAFKEHGRAELAGPLGAALALAVGVHAVLLPGRPVLLVPVPASRAALRARGRDCVRELAAVAVADLRAAGVDAGSARLLTRAGRVRDSAGLSVAQRRANLAGTFAVRPGTLPAGALLVVVDDVVTSGATLSEAAAALGGTRRDHDTPVLAAVVAATPRPGARGRSPGGPGQGPCGAPPGRLDRLSGPRDSD
ncbi:Predicted amidophosphoribosyltransferases [Geodermatophilus amargosae]|uniref:Predicted amidophosphoribosyltransferases n=1 Tax=Geodermatophilus amargosae TaxID=1296565 RepID=A0A1I6XV25_9ACTN|nr:ComF family protein [Geodermatophilus amargosae]SFT42200.1 Predicted amidophosphoribosyltransferases [Geodermatophilus amargosae]